MRFVLVISAHIEAERFENVHFAHWTRAMLQQPWVDAGFVEEVPVEGLVLNMTSSNSITYWQGSILMQSPTTYGSMHTGQSDSSSLPLLRTVFVGIFVNTFLAALKRRRFRKEMHFVF